MKADNIINNIKEKHQELLLYCFSRCVGRNITSNLTGQYIEQKEEGGVFFSQNVKLICEDFWKIKLNVDSKCD